MPYFMKNCAYPGCKHSPKYFMSWGKGKSGLVCATHDRELGRTNLMKIMPLSDTILFEQYLNVTAFQEAGALNYLDWPEWRRQHLEKQKAHTKTPFTKEEFLDTLKKATEPIKPETKKERRRPCLKST